MYENRIRESNRFVLPVLQENVMAVYILWDVTSQSRLS
jgi:hypothetical protein